MVFATVIYGLILEVLILNKVTLPCFWSSYGGLRAVLSAICLVYRLCLGLSYGSMLVSVLRLSITSY